MIEMLVALGLGALILGALLSILSESLRHSSATQNEVVANSIMSELHDWTRSTSFSYLYNNAGTHVIYSNRTALAQPGSDTGLRQEPAQLDLVTNTWTPATKANAFNGEIKYSLFPLSPSQLRVVIDVSWSDGLLRGSGSTPGRTVERSFLVNRFGTNAYAQ